MEELGRIILAYSEVTEKLQQSHEQLNTKVKQLQEELSDKNRQLERRNRLAALGEMAAGLAHEIRNPLGGIQLYASLLAQDVADRPDSALTVKKIINGVKRLEGLVSQVLQFSREIRANPEQCDVAQVVRDAWDIAIAKAHGMPGVGFECAIPDELNAVIDDHLLTQAIINLTHNAIDAVGETGTVRIELLPSKDAHFTLTISDTGPGIPGNLLDKIFNPFFTTKDDGTGLGLSIVHRIVEAHGGTISASKPPRQGSCGGGARFEIRI